MTQPSASQVRKSVDSAVRWLVLHGLADDLNLAVSQKRPRGVEIISYPGADDIQFRQMHQPYRDVYSYFDQHRAFNAKLIDGALVQISYEFKRSHISKHRLAYLPAPSPSQFQHESVIDLEDPTYRYFAAEDVLPVPMRFDFDSDAHAEVTHPASHLTLGQYQGCRIPVSSALPPLTFFSLIARSFYTSVFVENEETFPSSNISFAQSITLDEAVFTHVKVGV